VVVFDVGLQCATLVYVAVLVHSRSCKSYLRNVLSAGLWRWRMPTASTVVICINKCPFYFTSMYISTLWGNSQSNVGLFEFFFLNVLRLLNINIAVQLQFLNVHHSPQLCATSLLAVPTNAAPMSHTCLWRYLQVCCLMDLQSIFPLPDVSANLTATIYHLLPLGQHSWIWTEPILNFSTRCSSVVTFALAALLQG
jgi:hypothetical protein